MAWLAIAALFHGHLHIHYRNPHDVMSFRDLGQSLYSRLGAQASVVRNSRAWRPSAFSKVEITIGDIGLFANRLCEHMFRQSLLFQHHSSLCVRGATL